MDTTYYIANIMFEEFRDPAYAPPPLLKRMCSPGAWVEKQGQGLLYVLADFITTTHTKKQVARLAFARVEYQSATCL